MRTVDLAEWQAAYADGGNRSETYYRDGSLKQVSGTAALGQLWKQVDPDGVTTFFTYNPKGEQDHQIAAVTTNTAAISS